MTETVHISEHFRPLYTSPKRYFLLTGGRGSLKTSTVMDYIARLTYEQDQVILYTRYTMSAAKTTIVPLFQKVLKRMGIESDFQVTNDNVKNIHTGSYVYFSGIKTSSGDQTGRLKSLPDVTTWIVEEGEDFNNERTFDDIDDSIRVNDIQNRVIWIQNPTTKEHFIYKRFIEKSNTKRNFYGYDVTVSTHPQVEHIHTTYHLAEALGYLSKSWLYKLNEAKKQAEEAVTNGKDKHETKYYYKYIGGWLERAEGAVFKNWSEGKFVETPYSGYGLDFGFNPDPLALVFVSLDKKQKKLYLQQKIYSTELAEEQLLDALHRVIESKRSLIVADTNEPRTRLKISKAGFNIIPAKKGKGSIIDDIRELQDYDIIVDPDSHKIKTELNNYVWNDKKASIPVDDFNHAIDAMRYIFRKLVGNKRSGVKRRN